MNSKPIAGLLCWCLFTFTLYRCVDSLSRVHTAIECEGEETPAQQSGDRFGVHSSQQHDLESSVIPLKVRLEVERTVTRKPTSPVTSITTLYEESPSTSIRAGIKGLCTKLTFYHSLP
ncbi:Hypothetical predicted protein [Pelobates cultripes]|uniref:Secreted protein n=1 Tax=Pelobates cultripes TaxID=61616 RepID=A0AAD1RYW1_PELCU|nr:Hypothetical predicted protein [Pelobates cultripes]